MYKTRMRKTFPAGVRLIYRKKRNGNYFNVLSILYLEAKILTSVHFIHQKTKNRILRMIFLDCTKGSLIEI